MTRDDPSMPAHSRSESVPRRRLLAGIAAAGTAAVAGCAG
ncbi:nitrous oxide reductase accessory protein NosL, partial [Halorubrum distributum]